MSSDNADLVKDIRNSLKMSRDEFSFMLGVDSTTVYSWEKDTSNPSAKAMRKLQELKKIVESLSEMFDTGDIPGWFKNPRTDLDYCSPADRLSLDFDKGLEEIRRLVDSIAWGAFS